MIENLPYRPCVGMMVINNKNNIFVGKRIDTRSEAWQMPQGGIDDDEDVTQAALRELREEIGTDNVEIISQIDRWLYYDLPEDLVPTIWNGKYRGQKQKWLAMRFLGDDDQINIKTKHPEFCQWKWEEINNLPNIIVPFKKDIYTEIIEEFRDIVLD